MNMLSPSTKSWMTLLLPPDRYEPIEVRLADETVQPAVWTGAQWWSNGHQILPQAWRPVRGAFEFDGAMPQH